MTPRSTQPASLRLNSALEDGVSYSWASSPAVRRVMLGNRSRDTSPELRLRAALHRAGLRFWKHRRPLPTLRCEADVVFPRIRLAVFVDGCFWHGCPRHGTAPKSNSEWWRVKLERIRTRDRRNLRRLRYRGWVVLRVWEHQVDCDLDSAVARVLKAKRVAATSRRSVKATSRGRRSSSTHGDRPRTLRLPRAVRTRELARSRCS